MSKWQSDANNQPWVKIMHKLKYELMNIRGNVTVTTKYNAAASKQQTVNYSESFQKKKDVELESKLQLQLAKYTWFDELML